MGFKRKKDYSASYSYLLVCVCVCVFIFWTKDGLLSVPSKVCLSGQIVELDSGYLKLIVFWLFIISI